MTAAPGPRSSRPRSEANYGPQRGTTYLIHIDPPYKHAKHYKGWTERPVNRRFADHLAGRGALLTRLAVQAGSRLTLARVWPDTTKDREDSIKRKSGKRMCPECGVKPATSRLASDKAPAAGDRRPMWMADRDGQWDDGTPIIFDPDQTWEQARAIRAAMQIPEPGPAGQAELAALDELQRQWINQEEQVGLRNAIARGAAAMRDRREAHQRAVADREADRLWAIADALDRQMGRQPGYQHELTAERAARIRARLGEDLVQDARLQAMPQAEGQPLEHRAITPDDVAQAGREPVLRGAERDAEIDRLAAALPESGWPPVPGRDATAAEVAAWEEWAWEQGERERAEARAEQEQQWAEDARHDAEADGDPAWTPPGPDYVPEPEGEHPAAWDRYVSSAPGSEQHRAAYVDMHREAAGEGFAGADPDQSYLADHGYQTEADRVRRAEGYAAAAAGPAERAAWDATLANAGAYEAGMAPPGPEPGADAATWSPALEAASAADDALHAELGRPPERQAEAAQGPDIVADYLRRDLEERATAAEALRRLEARALAREHIAQASHDGAGAAAAREQARAFRQARLHAQAEAYGTAAALQEDAAQADRERAEASPQPEPAERMEGGAAARPAGTSHADPALAERGWQADRHGVYVRNPEAEAPGGRRELAGYEADSPDHQYGAPECAEADPEGAHFGRAPGEPMDAGRWPVLQADYGRMYIGQPQAQAEAV